MPACGVTAQGLRALLAEDNLINQRVASKMLALLGMQCTVVSNGADAVQEVARAASMPAGAGAAGAAAGSAAGGAAAQPSQQQQGQGQQYDIVLMDMSMPRMGGVEATQHIRAAGHNLPIVAMTANASDRDRDECAAAGMDGFLSKPVLKEQLASAIMAALRVKAPSPPPLQH